MKHIKYLLTGLLIVVIPVVGLFLLITYIEIIAKIGLCCILCIAFYQLGKVWYEPKH